MKTWNSLTQSGPAAAAMLAGVLVLATGCVGERITYVQQPTPVTVQAPEPPPAPAVPMRSAADLDRMLAPIALYPDPLLAQLLPAATLPTQVVLADRYLREGGDVNQVDVQPWDNSLKALARYPATLRMLDDNLAWTTDLGQAFLNQPADVMDSIQRLRAQAQALGNLLSTPQQTVVVDQGIIEIVPAAPQVIYVPVYQPEVVYVQPPPAPGRFYVSFGAGLVVGAWLNHDCDWHAHEVIVWHQDHPRPADWWYHPSSQRETPRVVNNVTVVNKTTIVNQNFTVWRPRASGAVANRGDRGWGQPQVPVPAPARNEVARPERADVRQPPVVAAAPKPVPTREVRPAPPVQEVRPSPPEIQRPPAQVPPREASTVKPPVTKPPAPETQRPVNAQPPSAREEKPAPRPNPPIAAPKDTRPVPAPVASKPPAVVTSTPRPAAPPMAKAPATETARPANNQQASTRIAAPALRPSQPIPAPKDTRLVPTPVAPKQPSAVTSTPRPAAASATPRPVANPTVRAPADALAGIESARVAREASARGLQSREVMAKPAAPARPAPAPVPSPKANSAETKKPQNPRKD